MMKINAGRVSCYTAGIANNDGLSMPGKQQNVEFPDCLFNTWLDYREAQGQTRAEVIREVNSKLDRKYDNNAFYRFKKRQKSVSDRLILDFVEPELADALKWWFNEHGYPIKGIDFEHLAAAVCPPVKEDATS
ncbi:hypothetical protein [Gilvimarinus chinensis]|uniref:hypothetical protein n=1 Tax=Gilvimarinus chinensis TaxID=396005 RepID=UPI000367FF46|nr:hypothetical protein [Gilvimarinus chinensis]